MAGSPVAAGATLRDARGEDAPGIAAMHVASWRAAYPGLLPEAVLEGLSVARRTATWERVLADRRQHVVVAERDGRRDRGGPHRPGPRRRSRADDRTARDLVPGAG